MELREIRTLAFEKPLSLLGVTSAALSPCNQLLALHCSDGYALLYVICKDGPVLVSGFESRVTVGLSWLSPSTASSEHSSKVAYLVTTSADRLTFHTLHIPDQAQLGDEHECDTFSFQLQQPAYYVFRMSEIVFPFQKGWSFNFDQQVSQQRSGLATSKRYLQYKVDILFNPHTDINQLEVENQTSEQLETVVECLSVDKSLGQLLLVLHCTAWTGETPPISPKARSKLFAKKAPVVEPRLVAAVFSLPSAVLRCSSVFSLEPTDAHRPQQQNTTRSHSANTSFARFRLAQDRVFAIYAERHLYVWGVASTTLKHTIDLADYLCPVRQPALSRIMACEPVHSGNGVAFVDERGIAYILSLTRDPIGLTYSDSRASAARETSRSPLEGKRNYATDTLYSFNESFDPERERLIKKYRSLMRASVPYSSLRKELDDQRQQGNRTLKHMDTSPVKAAATQEEKAVDTGTTALVDVSKRHACAVLIPNTPSGGVQLPPTFIAYSTTMLYIAGTATAQAASELASSDLHSTVSPSPDDDQPHTCCVRLMAFLLDRTEPFTVVQGGLVVPGDAVPFMWKGQVYLLRSCGLSTVISTKQVLREAAMTSSGTASLAQQDRHGHQTHGREGMWKSSLLMQVVGLGGYERAERVRRLNKLCTQAQMMIMSVGRAVEVQDRGTLQTILSSIMKSGEATGGRHISGVSFSVVALHVVRSMAVELALLLRTVLYDSGFVTFVFDQLSWFAAGVMNGVEYRQRLWLLEPLVSSLQRVRNTYDKNTNTSTNKGAGDLSQRAGLGHYRGMLPPWLHSLGLPLVDVDKPASVWSYWRTAVEGGVMGAGIVQLVMYYARSQSFHDVTHMVHTTVYRLLYESGGDMAVRMWEALGEDATANLHDVLADTLDNSVRSTAAAWLEAAGKLSEQERDVMETMRELQEAYPGDGYLLANDYCKEHMLQQQPGIAVKRQDVELEEWLRNGGALPGEVSGAFCGVYSITQSTDSDSDPQVVCGSSSSSSFADSSTTADIISNTPRYPYCCLALKWLQDASPEAIENLLLDAVVLSGNPVHSSGVSWNVAFAYATAHHMMEDAAQLLGTVPGHAVSVQDVVVRVDGGDQDYRMHQARMLNLPQGQPLSSLQRAVYEELAIKRGLFLTTTFPSLLSLLSLLARAHLLFTPLKGRAIDPIFHSSPGHPPAVASLEYRLPKPLPIATPPGRPRTPTRPRTLPRQPSRNASRPWDGGSPQDAGASVQVVGVQVGVQTGVHVMMTNFCIQHDLPITLQVYLDSQSAALTAEEAEPLMQVSLNCDWALWLLSSRITSLWHKSAYYNSRYMYGRVIGCLQDVLVQQGVMATLSMLVHQPGDLQSFVVAAVAKPQVECVFQPLHEALMSSGYTTLATALHDAMQEVAVAVGHSDSYAHIKRNVFVSERGDISLVELCEPYISPSSFQMLGHLVEPPPGGTNDHHPAAAVHQSGQASPATSTDAANEGRSTSSPAAVTLPESDDVVPPPPSSQPCGEQQRTDDVIAMFSQRTGEDHVQRAVQQCLLDGRPLAALDVFIEGYGCTPSFSSGEPEGANGLFSGVTERGCLQFSEDDTRRLLQLLYVTALTHYTQLQVVSACTTLLSLLGLQSWNLRLDIAALRKLHLHLTRQLTLLTMARPSQLHSIAHPLSRFSGLTEALQDEEAALQMATETPAPGLQASYEAMDHGSLPEGEVLFPETQLLEGTFDEADEVVEAVEDGALAGSTHDVVEEEEEREGVPFEVPGSRAAAAGVVETVEGDLGDAETTGDEFRAGERVAVVGSDAVLDNVDAPIFPSLAGVGPAGGEILGMDRPEVATLEVEMSTIRRDEPASLPGQAAESDPTTGPPPARLSFTGIDTATLFAVQEYVPVLTQPLGQAAQLHDADPACEMANELSYGLAREWKSFVGDVSNDMEHVGHAGPCSEGAEKLLTRLEEKLLAIGESSRAGDDMDPISCRQLLWWWQILVCYSQMHGLEVSGKLLEKFARKGDWIHFLAAAATHAFPHHQVVAVAAQNFPEPLSHHVLHVLRLSDMQDSHALLTALEYTSSGIERSQELFEIMAAVETHPAPGHFLLSKSSAVDWPLLCVLAACWLDVTPLQCLTVWLAVQQRGQGGNSGEGEAADGSVDIPEGHHALEILKKQIQDMCSPEGLPILIQGFEIFLVSVPLRHWMIFLKATITCSFSLAASEFELFVQAMQSHPRGHHRHHSAAHHTEGAPSASVSDHAWQLQTAFVCLEVLVVASEVPVVRRILLHYAQEMEAIGLTNGQRTSFRFLNTAYSMLGYALEKHTNWDRFRSSRAQQEAAGDVGGQQALSGVVDTAAMLAELNDKRDFEAARWLSSVCLSSTESVTQDQAEKLLADWMDLMWDDDLQHVAWQEINSLFVEQQSPPPLAATFFLNKAAVLQEEKKISPLQQYKLLEMALEWLMPSSHLAASSTGGVEVGSEGGRFPSVCPRSFLEDLLRCVLLLAAKLGVTPPRDLPHFDQGATTPLSRSHGSLTSSYSEAAPLSSSDSTPQDTLVWQHGLAQIEKILGTPTQDQIQWAVRHLLEVGNVRFARKLSRELPFPPIEMALVEAAQNLMRSCGTAVSGSDPHSEAAVGAVPDAVVKFLKRKGQLAPEGPYSPQTLLDALAKSCREGYGQSVCKSSRASLRAAKTLAINTADAEALGTRHVMELMLQRGRESALVGAAYGVARGLPQAEIAQLLAQAFMKGLLAARERQYDFEDEAEGGQGRQGSVSWTQDDLVECATVLSDKGDLGNALLQLLLDRQSALPPEVETEMMIAAHHYYNLSTSFDGNDVLQQLAAARTRAYAEENNYKPLAQLVTGLGTYTAAKLALVLLVRHDQLELLLQGQRQGGKPLEGDPSFKYLNLAILAAIAESAANGRPVEDVELVYHRFSMTRQLAQRLHNHGMDLYRQLQTGSFDDRLALTNKRLESMKAFAEACREFASTGCGVSSHKCCLMATMVGVQIVVGPQQSPTSWDKDRTTLLHTVSQYVAAVELLSSFRCHLPVNYLMEVSGLKDYREACFWLLTQSLLTGVYDIFTVPPSMLLFTAEVFREVTHMPSLKLSSSYLKLLRGKFQEVIRQVAKYSLRYEMLNRAGTDFGEELRQECRVLLDLHGHLDADVKARLPRFP